MRMERRRRSSGRCAGQRQVEHAARSREVERTIHLNRIDRDRAAEPQAKQFRETLARQLRIEAERHVRRESESWLLIRQSAELDLFMKSANRSIRIDRHDDDSTLHKSHRR